MIKFEYNGIMSDTKGVIVTLVENNDTIITRSPVTGEKNIYRPKENHFGMIYDDNITFTMRLIKNPCQSRETRPKFVNGTVIYPKLPELINGTLIFKLNEPYIKDGSLISSDYTDYFTSREVREITSWLTSPNQPKVFKFINADYFREQIEYLAVITEVSAEHGDKPSELIYTVKCDSPYGYTPEITQNITSVSTLNTPLNIYSDTDSLEDYIYPIIKVHPTSHGTLTINNITDDGILNIKMLKDADFFIDCRNLKIYDVVGEILSFDDLGINDIDNIYFPRLCAGDNLIEFTGNAEIEISYREPRKVGAFA